MATSRPLPSPPTGLPRLPASPFQRAVPITPADRTAACVDYFAVHTAFPAFWPGRHPHHGFRDAMGQTVGEMAPSSLKATRRWSIPMSELNDLSRSLTSLEQDKTIIAVIEMSQSSWLVAGVVPGIERHPLKKLEPSEEELVRLLMRWRSRSSARQQQPPWWNARASLRCRHQCRMPRGAL